MGLHPTRLSRQLLKAPVVIVAYVPRWPVLFEEEKARLLVAIGHVTTAVEHVGSTAVPGLGAKPIIRHSP